MTNAEDFRKKFDHAISVANDGEPLFSTDHMAQEMLELLSAEFRTACSALRDVLLGRGLPGYPVVHEGTGAASSDRAFFIGSWTEDDEDDGFEDNVPAVPYSVHTFVLLTSGIVTTARWLSERHAFAVAAKPQWLPLAVRRDYRQKYRLVSATTPFDCGNLVEHLTSVAAAGGKFYRYGTDLYLVQYPRDEPISWERA